MSSNEYPNLYDSTYNFLLTQKQLFEGQSHMMPAGNHKEHDLDPDYWKILLGPIRLEPDEFIGSRALDFGCGCGRNLVNMLSVAHFERVDGCDISPSNAAYAEEYVNHYYPNRGKTWESNGWDLGPPGKIEDNSYKFIMSHVVFQHIGNHTVRYNILEDMFRALQPAGIISLHYMDLTDSVPYYHNSSQGDSNCRVENPEFLMRDLESIGYHLPTVVTRIDMYSGRRSYFVKATKKPPSLLISGEEE